MSDWARSFLKSADPARTIPATLTCADMMGGAAAVRQGGRGRWMGRPRGGGEGCSGGGERCSGGGGEERRGERKDRAEERRGAHLVIGDEHLRRRLGDFAHVVVPLLEAEAREAQRRLTAAAVLLGQVDRELVQHLARVARQRACVRRAGDVQWRWSGCGVGGVGGVGGRGRLTAPPARGSPGVAVAAVSAPVRAGAATVPDRDRLASLGAWARAPPPGQHRGVARRGGAARRGAERKQARGRATPPTRARAPKSEPLPSITMKPNLSSDSSSSASACAPERRRRRSVSRRGRVSNQGESEGGE